MRSLYVTVLLAMIVTLSLSLIAFFAITDRMYKHYLDPVFDAMDELELESARTALDQGGVSALSAYMDRLDRLFGDFHYVLDANGIDIVSGQRRSELLPPSPGTASRGRVNDQYVVTHKSTDGRYWLVAVDRRPPDQWTLFPYYLLVVGATGILCWLAAVGVVSPI